MADLLFSQLNRIKNECLINYCCWGVGVGGFRCYQSGTRTPVSGFQLPHRCKISRTDVTCLWSHSSFHLDDVYKFITLQILNDLFIHFIVYLFIYLEALSVQ